MGLPKVFGLNDPATIDRALNELKLRRAYESCPRCGTKKWLAELVALHVSELPKNPPGFLTQGSYVPSLSLTCANCGCVFLHNLINLGIKP
jgi:ribosomal protein S27AE